MVYKIRLIRLDNSAQICFEGKRAETIIWPRELNVGGMYFLRPGKLYRVEGVIERPR
ncbi:MAG: hypothetical protein ACI3U8_02210 [Candidatus Onthomonas sp.]